MAGHIPCHVTVKDHLPNPANEAYPRIPVVGDFIEVGLHQYGVLLCVVKQVILHKSEIMPPTIYAEALDPTIRTLEQMG